MPTPLIITSTETITIKMKKIITNTMLSVKSQKKNPTNTRGRKSREIKPL